MPNEVVLNIWCAGPWRLVRVFCTRTQDGAPDIGGGGGKRIIEGGPHPIPVQNQTKSQ